MTSRHGRTTRPQRGLRSLRLRTRTRTAALLPRLSIRRADGSITHSFELDPAWGLDGLDVSLDAWTTEGIILSGTSTDAGSATAPVVRAISPDGTSASPVRGVDAVVSLGSGQVLVLRTSGDRECFAVGATLASAAETGCVAGTLDVSTSAGGAAVVRQLDDQGRTPAEARVWLLDPDGTSHPALAPSVTDLLGGTMLWEAPGVALFQVVGDGGEATWVRWDVQRGALERTPRSSGAVVQG